MINKAILIMIVISAISSGYYYVTNLQNENDRITRNYALQLGENEANKKSFNENQIQLYETIDATRGAHERLLRDYARIEGERNALSKKLQDHDFEYLAWKKPGLIERRSNRATTELFKRISESTRRFANGDIQRDTEGDRSTTETE